MRKRNLWSREKLLAYQDHKLKEIRKYAYNHSNFYKEFHEGLLDAPLSQLPVLTKSLMMQNFDDLITDHSLSIKEIKDFIVKDNDQLNYKRKYWINITSGSTGNPGIFVFDTEGWCTIMAGFSRMEELAGNKLSILNSPKRAVVASLKKTHMSSLVAKTVGDFFMSMLRLDVTEKIDVIVEKLNQFQPDILVGYASTLNILAEEQSKNNLKINPHKIFSTSEVLTIDMRKKIENVFGKILFDGYASSEVGVIAGECEYHSGLHLLDDNVIIEVVDKNNQPVIEGAFGDKLLITVLFNRIQPLIRYELSDSIKLSYKPCPCGRPFILAEDIQGRTEDFLYFDSSGKEVIIHPNKIHAIMEFVPVTSWQLVLKDKSLEVLLIGLKKDYSHQKIYSELTSLLKNEGISGVDISVRDVSSIPKSVGGKSPLIKNLNLKG